MLGSHVADGDDRDCDGFEECYINVDGDPQGGSTIIPDDGDGVCQAADDESTTTGDCDDGDDTVNPTVPEVENGIDDDCDGAIDEDFLDQDGDGYTSADGDCDDLDGWSNPGAAEICDGIDNDCNGEKDEGCANGGAAKEPVGGCSCASGHGGDRGLVLWLVAWGLMCRRRS